MKIKLQLLLVAIIMTTSAGWAQTSTIYVNASSGNDGNAGTSTDIPVRSIAKAISLVSEGGTITVAAGQYTDDIVISKPLTLKGEGNKPTKESAASSNASFTGKIRITTLGTTHIENLLMVRAEDDNKSEHGNRTALVELPVSGIKLTISDCCFINNKQGTANGGATSNSCIYAYPEVTDCTLSVNSSDFYLNNKFQRCFNDGSQGPVIFKMRDSNIIGNEESGKSSYNRPLAFYSKGASMEIVNSVISVQHGYGITFAEDEMSCTIDNSEIKGYAGLYIFNNKHDIQIKNNSIISGRTFYNGSSDNFGAIVFEGSQECNLSVTNSIITNEYGTGITTYMWPILFNSVKDGDWLADKNKVTINHSRIRTTSENTPYLIEYNSNTENQIILGNGNSFSYNWNGVISKGNTQALEKDKECIYALDKDHHIINAAANINEFLSHVSIADVDEVIFPEGTFVLPSAFTLAKSLTIKGAGKDKTFIKGHMVVSPETGTTATLIASDLTLEGNNNSSKHGIIGIIGQGTGKVELTDCKIAGGTLKGQTAAVGVRMESVGAELSMTNTNIDAYYYGIGVRNTDQKVTIDGGTIEGWAALMTSAGGLSTSDGSLAKTNTIIEISNATLNAATISDEVYGAVVLQEKYNGVTLSIKNSNLTATDKRNDVHANGVKMLSALDLRSYGNTITVEGGTLSSSYGENTLGGAIVSLGYNGNDTNSTLANNTITINSDLKSKEGELPVYSNRKGKAKEYDKLTINGTDYSIASGLICYGAPITSGETFEQAIAGATDGEVISVSKDITLEKPLVINKAITLTSTNKSTIKGHLAIETENVTVKDLKFECNSTGYKYNEKNAISVFANKVTLTGNEFTQASGIGENYVTNGIVLYPQGQGEVEASYTITGNTFDGITKKTETATSTPIIIRENFSDKSQLGDKGTTATLIDFTEDTAISAQNSFKQCAGGESYVRIKGDKYVYASLYNEDDGKGITDALTATDKKSILSISNLKVNDLAQLITGELPAFAYVECSDAWVVVTKEATELLPISSKPVALLVKGTGEAIVEYITKIPTIDLSKLTASGVDAGKTISSSILKGGSAVFEEKAIPGTFAWEHPDTIAVTSVTNYNVVFTPSDLTRYGKVTVSIPVEVTRYWTVTAGICDNGKLTIRNANAGNRYVDGTTLILDYTPDAHYKISASAPKTVKATKDQELTATFEQIMHKVTITSPTGGSLKVMNGDTEVSDGTNVAEGTTLKIIATPATTGGEGNNGYKLVTLTAGNNPVSNNVATVNGDLVITATFKALPASEYTVGFGNDIRNGKLAMMDANGNTVNAGASVKAGTKLTVIAIPDKGYLLYGNISTSGSSISGNICEVKKNTTFSASFTKKTYKVTSEVGNKGTLVIRNKESDSEISGDDLNNIPYGTLLTAQATVTDTDYKVGPLVVNGKQIANGAEFIVTEATKIVVSMIEKATINFINLKQTAIYDGTEKQFVVQSIPAGLDGFSVSYDGISSGSLPVNAADNREKEYKVTICRDADDVYKAVKITDASLTIEAADLKGVSAPVYGSQTKKWASTAGTCSAKQVEKSTFYNVTVTPTDKNYKKAVFNLPQNTEGLTVVSLGTSGLRSAYLKSTGASLTVTAHNGGISLWNGAERLTSASTVYAGQKLTVKGEPDAGYTDIVDWSINNTSVTSDQEKSITLINGNNSINVTFPTKVIPENKPTVESKDLSYTGNPIQPVIKLENSAILWNILVKKDGVIVENPTDAGTYEVWAQCSEQEQFAAFNDRIGSYTIIPQELAKDIAVTGATPILKGQNIGLSELTGNAPVEGIFMWSDPEQTAEGNNEGATTSIPYAVTFTPASSNYTVTASMNLTQAIPFHASTKVEIRKIIFTETTNGTFIVKVNGTEVKSGTQITEGDKMIVETSPDTDYTASVSINKTSVSGNEWTVPAEGNVTVVVTFTKNGSGEGGGEEPEIIEITGISLAPSSKSLIVGEEFILEASVEPASAEQSVTWSSSDETIASVKNGTVKALKTGKATITATASDDEHYTTCEVIVSVPTGIGELLASSRILGRDGCIMIEPATAIEIVVTDMTGRMIYHDRITDKVQISVSEGLYLVRLSNNEKAVTTKVIVRK